MAGATKSTLTLDELAAWAERAGLDLASADFTEPLTEAKYLIAADVKENFAGSHDPDGNPWAPLKNPTRKSGRAGQALWDTGRLIGSTGAGPGHVEEMGRDSLVYGTNVEYASIHNETGAQLPERRAAPGKVFAFMGPSGLIFSRKLKAATIPVRRFIGIGEQLAEAIREVFARWVDRLLGG